MKILWVKAGGLVPLDTGGKIRSYHILRELAKRHAVSLFTFYAQHPNDVHEQLTELFERVICIPLQIPIPRSHGETFHFARYVASPLPYSVAKHSQPQVKAAIRNLLAIEPYDVIVCDFIAAAGVIPWDFPHPKILFTHNVETQIWERHIKTAVNPIWKAISWNECRKMSRYERFCLNNAQHVLTVSEYDRDAFSIIIARDRMTVIPTGVDTQYFRPAASSGNPNNLVFTGSMDWLPNVDAILHFAKEILPLIRKQIPNVIVTLAGRNPSPKLVALAQADKSFRTTGTVPDIRPYVADASVFIVPLRIGGGTRLKIFEAMAMGKAVVSTAIGAEGLPVTHGKDIVIADTPQDFAHAVVSLLCQPDERNRLGASARRLVEQKYSWAVVANLFERMLCRVAYEHGTLAALSQQPVLSQVGASYSGENQS